jgi:N-acetyl-gamma-glutamyl-phosphate reductase
MVGDKVRIGILGASGYTGAELLRLLGDHPRAEIRALTAERQAGKPVAEVWPHLAPYDLPDLVKIGDLDVGGLDVVFCCLPHATTQAIIRDLPRGPKVIDLSADFRLRDPAAYEATYGHPHAALAQQNDAVYGLTEHYRDAIMRTWLVANPGLPHDDRAAAARAAGQARAGPARGHHHRLQDGGERGRPGREAGQLFTEVAEGINAYGVATHRHTPEIEQCLEDFAGAPVRVTFTPHLIPMSRGILATIYLRLSPGAEPADLHAALAEAYAGEPFAHVLPFRTLPATRHVRGTNLCLIGVHPSRIPGEAIIVSAIDNLVKGASGQAIQNMNAMLGFDERTGLRQRPLFP